MDTQTTELPATTWQLSAPESYVLLNGPAADGTETFKLAVTELVARGLLRVVDVEQPGFLGQTRHTSVLVRGDTQPAPSEGPLRSVWELLQGLEPTSFPDGTTGVPVARLAAAAETRYGSLDRYAADVLAELERRGLYELEAYRVLWLFPATRWRLTPAGQEARAELERLIAIGDQRFSGWVNDNPSQALMYTALAGSALLLMPDMYPDMHRLHQGTDLGAGALLVDPGAFASLDSSFSAIDAGGDSGAGESDWGGGTDDGGGADGGGSSE